MEVAGEGTAPLWQEISRSDVQAKGVLLPCQDWCALRSQLNNQVGWISGPRVSSSHFQGSPPRMSH